VKFGKNQSHLGRRPFAVGIQAGKLNGVPFRRVTRRVSESERVRRADTKWEVVVMKASRAVFPLIVVVLGGLSASGQDTKKLEERLRILETRLAQLEGSSVVEQVGAVTLTIPPGRTEAGETIKFDRPQPEQAIVLTGETGTLGAWVVTKSQGITRTKFSIVAIFSDNKPRTGAYKTRIGYVVLRGDPGAERVASVGKPQPHKQPVQGTSQAASLTWAQYRTDCGKDAQEQNEARTEEVFRLKYKGKRVRWSGGG